VPRISCLQGAGITGIADEAGTGLGWTNGFANYWLPYCMAIASPLLVPFAKEITLLSLAATAKGNEAFRRPIVMAMLSMDWHRTRGGSTAC
jgi:hypothetical protein